MGENCKVNFLCRFTKKNIISNNCHFDETGITGGGEVCFNNNFHSGRDCIILTSFHNYGKGTKISYDNTYIEKNVTIEDNV